MSEYNYSAPEWYSLAACSQRKNRHLNFFGDTKAEDHTDCLRVCWGECQVRELCEDLGEDEEIGIWGGIIPAARRRARKERGEA